ncbi:hypothetical protein ACIBH1_38325 [Nonomuraea sp. NPDC050663]|uniref:hypothetical protein n=1 Tax=Nonomuraea sp. NPDC050663 TaxID=3364370 RepID=UPI003794AAAB
MMILLLALPLLHADWTVTEAPRETHWVNPCGDARLGAAGRVEVLNAQKHAPASSRLEEIARYRNVKAAKQAMADLRGALVRCARTDDGSGLGRDQVWTSASVKAGDEALRVAMQSHHGSRPTLHGQRAVVARQGRYVMVYAHADEGSALPRASDFRRHLKDAQVTARRLR